MGYTLFSVTKVQPIFPICIRCSRKAAIYAAEATISWRELTAANP